MTGSIRKRILAPALAFALAGALVTPAATGAAGQPAEPYVPWVTDFGGGTTPTESPDAEPGLDWTDLAIGAAAGFGLAAGLGAAGAAVRGRRGAGWPARSGTERVAS